MQHFPRSRCRFPGAAAYDLKSLTDAKNWVNLDVRAGADGRFGPGGSNADSALPLDEID